MHKAWLALYMAVVLIGFGVTYSLANDSLIKPSASSHHENIFNDGDIDSVYHSTQVYDGEADDRSTYSSVYQLHDEEQDWVVVYGFDAHENVEEAILHVNYTFPQQVANDGFGIYYSLEGNEYCHSDFQSGDWVRTWHEMDSVSDPFTDIAHLSAELSTIADTSEICLLFDAEVVGSADEVTALDEANRLDIYDIWLDINPKEVDAYVNLGYEEMQLYAGGEVTIVHDFGVLTEDTDSFMAVIEPAAGMELVSSSIDLNTIDNGYAVDLTNVAYGEQQSFDVTYRFSDDRFGLMGYNASIIPESAKEIDWVDNDEQLLLIVDAEYSEPVCEAVCEDVALYTYLVNPDGSVRETYSEYAVITPLGYRHFQIAFEDSGSDFDYNDVVIELDVSDCTNVQVAMVSMDAGWHHKVYGSLYHNDTWVMDLTIAEDTHGITEAISLDMRDYMPIPMCSY